MSAQRAARRARTPAQQFRKDLSRRRRLIYRITEDPTLTDATKVVALAALRYSDDSAKPVYPAMAALAKGAALQRRSARRCVVDLIEAGYVHRIQRRCDHRVSATNLYYFAIPPGSPPAHRDGQRRRPRTRVGRTGPGGQNPCSDRGTLETREPAELVPNPSAAGAAQPTPPPRSPNDHRQRPSRPAVAAQPPAWRPAEPSGPPPTTTAGGPDGPQRRPASGGPGTQGEVAPPAPVDETRAAAARAHLEAARAALRGGA